MKKFFELLFDLIYKKKCYFCGNSKYSLKMCPMCYSKLEFCDRTANRIVNGIDIYCAGHYTKELQKLIRGLKYHNQKELAYYQAKFMYDYFLSLDLFQNRNFVVVPVPLHKNRIRKRKYNHMELVATEFGKMANFECSFDFITRIKDTKPQYKLSRKERLENLSDAFEIDNTKIPEKPILLIDDICTTGATFEEIIKVLKNNNITNITCFATSTPI